MSCREVEGRLTDLLDGRLDTAAQLRLHAHVEGCATCRAKGELWSRLTPALRAVEPAPLDEMRLRRLEVALDRARGRAPAVARRPRRGLAWAAAAVAAAAGIAFVVQRARPDVAPLRAEVRSVRGARGLAAGDALEAGRTLALGDGGDAELTLGAGTTVGLRGPARLTLRGSRKDVELALAEGVLDAVVAHRRPGETFSVTMTGMRVIVRGTRFTVSSTPPRAWVRVDEGRVAVVDGNGVERSVSAGETWALPRTPAPSAPQPAAEPADDAPCTAARGCEATARQARSAMREGGVRRALALLSAAPRSAEGDIGGACGDARASCRRELGYLEAEALRLDGRLDAAVLAYKRLDQKGAPSATRQNALYAAAQLEQRLGHARAARVDYERAFAAAPAGALNAEALLGAMNGASEAHELDGARALARRYLRQFPGGSGAPRARLLVGESPAGPRE